MDLSRLALDDEELTEKLTKNKEGQANSILSSFYFIIYQVIAFRTNDKNSMRGVHKCWLKNGGKAMYSENTLKRVRRRRM